MPTTPIDTAIRTQIDQFLTSISQLVRQAAVEAVKEALGGTDGKVAGSARRGPGRPRKVAAGATTAPTALKASKSGKRARRSAEDVEQVAGQVLAYVQSNPGHRLEEIGRGLKVDTGGLKGPIKVLLGTGRLRTEGQKRGTKYFAGAGKAAAGPGRKAGKRAGKRAKKK